MCTFKAGNISSCIDIWERIGTNKTVLNWIETGVQIQVDDEPSQFCLQNWKLSLHETLFIDNEIRNLVKVGALQISTEKPFCVSPLGCVPKKNGTYRIIVDLRRLNSYICCPSFQYEDINTILDCVKPNDQLVTIDITNGFYHIPVHKNYQKYLGIQWKRRYYVWKCLPFGLCVSPYYFFVKQYGRLYNILDHIVIVYQYT